MASIVTLEEVAATVPSCPRITIRALRHRHTMTATQPEIPVTLDTGLTLGLPSGPYPLLQILWLAVVVLKLHTSALRPLIRRPIPARRLATYAWPSVPAMPLQAKFLPLRPLARPLSTRRQIACPTLPAVIVPAAFYKACANSALTSKPAYV